MIVSYYPKRNGLCDNRIAEQHMRNGVTIISPENTYISADAEIGRDTILQPGQ